MKYIALTLITLVLFNVISITAQVETVTFSGFTQGLYNKEWSSDGQRLAFQEPATGELWFVANPNTGELEEFDDYPFSADLTTTEEQLFPTEDVRRTSPDGQLLLYGVPDSSSVLEQERDNLLSFHQLAWSPDGNTLAIAGGYPTCSLDPNHASQYTIHLLNSTTGQIDQSLLGHRCAPKSIAWSPDGTKLASSDVDGVRIWDIPTGQMTLHEFPESGNSIVSIEWSPDGTQIANLVASAAYIAIWDVNTGETISVVGGPETSFSMAWSSNGNQLAVGTTEGVITVWDPVTGNKVQTLSGHTDTIRSVAWSPNNDRLASGSVDDTVRIWDATIGTLLREFESHNDAVNTVDWSPSGDFIASGSSDGTVYVWDTTTGQILDSVQGTGKSVVDAEWSPNVNKIAYLYSFGSLEGATPAINIFEPLLELPTPTPE